MSYSQPPREPSSQSVEHHRGAGVQLGTAVAFAVSDATGMPVTDMDIVLHDYVDPDALHALFAPRDDGTPRPPGRVSFEVGDCEVTVMGDRQIVARLAGDNSLDSTGPTATRPVAGSQPQTDRDTSL
jgi:hypothetical protein